MSDKSVMHREATTAEEDESRSTWRYPVLRTKLYIPTVRGGSVSRKRLLQRLSSGLDARLTIISAPPGFGKTTLVVDWSRSSYAQGWDLAWVSLDEADSDPARFLTYLIHAFRTVEPEIGDEAIRFLEGIERLAIEAPLTILLNDLNRLDRHIVLTLDDYHVIENDLVHEAMLFLIEHLPPAVRIIVTSRIEPPLQLSRLRGRRELTEFGAEDLRFTVEEAHHFLVDVMGLTLDDEHVRMLEERTEGWAAGLLLAALSVSGSDEPAGAIETFSGEHQFVFDYLAEEVLAQQPPEIVDFLLRTSVLERMNADLSRAITGMDDPQQVLEWLEQRNLFIVPLDDRRDWYRYHHLFAEFLETRFHRLLPEEWRETRRRAAIWYAERRWWHQSI